MSNSEVGSISLGLNVDTSQVSQSIHNCADRVNRQMVTAFNSAGGSAQSAMTRIANSIDNATNKLNRQMAAIEAQRNTISRLNESLEQTREKYNEQTGAIERQEQIVRQLETTYGQLTNQIGPPTRENAREIERLSRRLEAARSRLSGLNQSAATTRNRMAGMTDSIGSANTRLENLQTEARQTQRHIEELNVELNNVGSGLQNTGNGMNGLASSFKKIGVAMLAAFSVKKIMDFGASCIELGSNLAEVQNVVDVTFPAMSAQVDKFAKSAAGSFGLSETMAKKFTGTFGAMAKAFGFSESAAYDMGTTLTGLAGDVASFYNITQDEAYTKLKSVFTGETETLKDLG